MSIARFVPEIWAAELLVSLKKTHIYAYLANRDYEGEIQEAGNTVKITSISRPTVNDYVRNTAIEYEELTDAQRTLIVDQEKYWAFSVDDVDKAQAKGDVVGPAMEEAAYAVNDTVDTYVAGMYTQTAASNNLGTVSITTPAIAYTQLRKLALKLTTSNVPKQGRWVVLPPWYASLLLEDERFVKTSSDVSQHNLREGFVKRALGLDIFESNNAPNPTGDDHVVMAGTNRAITFAAQVTKTEALKSEQTFAERLRGLYVYGAKVIRPDGLAVMTASET